MPKAPGLAVVAAVLALAAPTRGQTYLLDQIDVEMQIDSGLVVNETGRRGVIFAAEAAAPDAPWLRLLFDTVQLGAAPVGGEATVLRLTSQFDGAVQTLDDVGVVQWQYTSAYFNGDAVLLEIVADPGAAPSRVSLFNGLAGAQVPTVGTSICGPDDDRVLSSDVRAGRIEPIGCTAWLIDDANHCFLTAGHCTGSNFEIVEFNVPLSDSNGNRQHPGPEDQYPIDPLSAQSNGGQGVGDDWAYFGCFANTETGLTPFQAQGDFFVLAASPPADTGQLIRITGYGSTDPPVPNEWNGAQKTHAGPYAGTSGTAVNYQTDTTGGNSGSPIIDESTGLAIGIHTHGGCSAGANAGTAIDHGPLQLALADPQGVCFPLLPIAFDFSDGLPELLDPAGDTIRVEVSGQNGGTPSPDTGMLHYEVVVTGPGGGNEDDLVTVPMVEVTPNVYDAVFPAIECGRMVTYFFSAEDTAGASIAEPFGAPTSRFESTVGLAFDVTFADDFETDTGWTVTSDPGLTDGAWERGAPAGGGDRGDPPADGDGSGQCYVTDNADGNSDVDDGSTVLTSPAMDATQGDAHVSYRRWYSNTFGGSPEADVFVVEISDDDGASWQPLETVGPTGPEVDGEWFFRSFRVADSVTPTAQVRLRFTASDLDAGSVIEAGVDDVRMSRSDLGVLCAAPCVEDLSGDGAIDVVDLLDLLAAWGTGPGVPQDLDGDGTVGINDLLQLLAAWGPCAP